jgi:flagella basal body P-ring formation protein FlgA
MVAPANPVVIVKRNQTVVIRIEIPGLLITAMGKAMRDGRSGEYIKVQNVDSRRIIYARVNEDGTVQPLF